MKKFNLFGAITIVMLLFISISVNAQAYVSLDQAKEIVFEQLQLKDRALANPDQGNTMDVNALKNAVVEYAFTKNLYVNLKGGMKVSNALFVSRTQTEKEIKDVDENTVDHIQSFFSQLLTQE